MMNRLLNLLPAFTDTVRRFPVAAVIAFVTCVAVNATTAFGDDNAVSDWFLIGSAAFLGAAIGHVFAESRRMSFAGNNGLALIGAALAGAVMAFFNVMQTFEAFLLLGLWLLLMVAAYLRRRAEQEALWMFNMKLHLAFVLACCVSVIFGIGLSAVVAGLDFLFDIDFGYRSYQYIWLTAVTFVAPIYAMSLIPTDLDDEIEISVHKGTLVERAVSVAVNYVLVPLVVVYAVILHAYAVKIILNWGLPRGEIGIIVSLFAAGGTAIWLLAWPWREQGTRLLRWFMMGWFWLLPVPVVLLVMAIARRITDYGVTPERFGIGLVAVWAAIVFLYLALRRKKADMRVLIGSAALLLLVTSFGPWGAYGVTARDQFARLTTMLSDAGVIKDGTFVKKADLVAQGEKLSGAFSIVQVLRDVRRLEGVQAWFGDDASIEKSLARFANWNSAVQLTDKLGISSSNTAPDIVVVGASGSIDLDMSRAQRIFGPVYMPLQQSASPSADTRIPKDFTATADKSVFRLKVGTHEVVMPTAELMTKLKAFSANTNPLTPMHRLDLDAKITLIISSAYGRTGSDPELNSLHGWVVVWE
jgi:hypothetical protein